MTPSIRPLSGIAWTACPAVVARLRCLGRGMGLLSAPATLRISAAAAAGVIAAVTVGFAGRWPYAPAVGWITAAGIYLAWTWLLIGPMDAAGTEEHATSHADDD